MKITAVPNKDVRLDVKVNLTEQNLTSPFQNEQGTGTEFKTLIQ
jgi:hypothetical protein